MIKPVAGLHHITAIAGPAQENLDFYSGILGMRLVKRSVNQDDPGTYHLFYADADGHPGTDLTFFSWSHLAPARKGWGLSTEVSLTVLPGSLSFWTERFDQNNVDHLPLAERFGQKTLPFNDVHGLRLALVENEEAEGRDFTPWRNSSVPDTYQVRGLECARMLERDLVATTEFLTKAMQFRLVASEGGWHRYAVGGDASGNYVDIAESPTSGRGAWGTGSIHHLAWRVNDASHQNETREAVIRGGAHPTEVIDRFWFKSVYFKEPGGVLFELATDGPGFAADEDPAHLGEALVLPPWLETNRAEIEEALPALTSPSG